jgi:hypothetical protein
MLASILVRSFDLAAGGDACLKRRLEANWLVVLLQEVREGCAREFLKTLTSLTSDCLNRLPSLVIELDALSGHASLHLIGGVNVSLKADTFPSRTNIE